jgi:ATP-binding protein involved in chromosome partitioning
MLLSAIRIRKYTPRCRTRNLYSGVKSFCSLNSITARDSVLKALSAIIDPDLKRDIVSLGFIKELKIDTASGNVNFDLELTTPACPVKEQFVTACNSALKDNISWVKSVNVNLTSRKRSAPATASGLARVSNIIAVSSCKGGVGKSSVAYHLATSIREKYGARVGLLDADIYGPSLPSLVPNAVKGPFDESLPKQVQVYVNPANDLRLMSIGYLKPNESIALRGPMVSGMIQQLLTSTGWGELDYLIIDMPPGTGDIHLTIGQQAPIDGAVVVTTPQQLAIVDVEKGIELFNKLRIPSLALVENFSFFDCGTCSTRHSLFGRSGEAAKRIADKFGIDDQRYFQLPIDQTGMKSETTKKIIEDLAATVIREIAKKKYSNIETKLDRENGVIKISQTQNKSDVVFSGTIPFRKLRLNCKSATMIDEWTGEKLFKDEDIRMDVEPTKIEPAGNYAFRIDWSDGHHSIYPIKALKELGESK